MVSAPSPPVPTMSSTSGRPVLDANAAFAHRARGTDDLAGRFAFAASAAKSAAVRTGEIVSSMMPPIMRAESSAERSFPRKTARSSAG